MTWLRGLFAQQNLKLFGTHKGILQTKDEKKFERILPKNIWVYQVYEGRVRREIDILPVNEIYLAYIFQLPCITKKYFKWISKTYRRQFHSTCETRAYSFGPLWSWNILKHQKVMVSVPLLLSTETCTTYCLMYTNMLIWGKMYSRHGIIIRHSILIFNPFSYSFNINHKSL